MKSAEEQLKEIGPNVKHDHGPVRVLKGPHILWSL